MSVNVEMLKKDCIGKWVSIFQNLGIEVPHPPGKHGPCPICRGGTDRFRLDKDTENGGWFCNQCTPQAGDGISLIQKTLGLTFQETLERVNELVGTVEFTPPKTKTLPESRVKELLNELWKSSGPLIGSDPVSKYLHSRGLVLTPHNVRFCPACYESETKTKIHAMVAKVAGPNGHPVTIHRTYLQDGKKADIKSPKKLMPHSGNLSGAAIRLFPPTDVLGVAEGIETAIAATQLFEIPTWACISSAGLESFRPPEKIKKIVIFGDNDFTFTGQKSAFRLAHELHVKHDKIVDVQIPEGPGMDWADVVKQRMEG